MSKLRPRPFERGFEALDEWKKHGFHDENTPELLFLLAKGYQTSIAAARASIPPPSLPVLPSPSSEQGQLQQGTKRKEPEATKGKGKGKKGEGDFDAAGMNFSRTARLTTTSLTTWS